jgi:hypothetical protein
MADEFRTFAVAIPAGTAQASPVATAMAMPFDRIVEAVEFRVPPGCAGVVGFALQSAHQQIVPFVANTWIITDNEVLIWEFSEVLSDGDWALLGWNTGQFAHTIQVRFRLTLERPVAAPVQPISALALSGTV